MTTDFIIYIINQYTLYKVFNFPSGTTSLYTYPPTFTSQQTSTCLERGDLAADYLKRLYVDLCKFALATRTCRVRQTAVTTRW